jgi:hypothetical protein
MLEKLDWKKVALKGVEGAVIAGGGSVVATGASTEDVITNLVCAAIGAAWKAGANWWKHRSDKKKK